MARQRCRRLERPTQRMTRLLPAAFAQNLCAGLLLLTGWKLQLQHVIEVFACEIPGTAEHDDRTAMRNKASRKMTSQVYLGHVLLCIIVGIAACDSGIMLLPLVGAQVKHIRFVQPIVPRPPLPQTLSIKSLTAQLVGQSPTKQQKLAAPERYQGRRDCPRWVRAWSVIHGGPTPLCQVQNKDGPEIVGLFGLLKLPGAPSIDEPLAMNHLTSTMPNTSRRTSPFTFQLPPRQQGRCAAQCAACVFCQI
mmetsp:Transcript_16281/g.38482  ORF Transcript_16281/g.38482 Transcript_16281/m.38482 type:complete len:249 (+) Transcript_16281:36-782(+)